MKLKKRVSAYWLAVFIALFAGEALPAAEPRVWDSTAVQALSDDIFLAAHRLVVECRTSPSNYLAGDTTGSHMRFRYHVRHFRSLAVDLSTAIEESKGKVRTEPIYNEMLHVMKDLEDYAIDNPRGAWGKVEKAVRAARKLLGEMSTFYVD